jgi:hypothetical protein
VLGNSVCTARHDTRKYESSVTWTLTHRPVFSAGPSTILPFSRWRSTASRQSPAVGVALPDTSRNLSATMEPCCAGDATNWAPRPCLASSM